MKKALVTITFALVLVVAVNAAVVGFAVSFQAQIEQSHVGYAKLGMEASGLQEADLKAHCIAVGKAACEQEFRRLVAIGVSKRQQDKNAELEAVMAEGLDNSLGN